MYMIIFHHWLLNPLFLTVGQVCVRVPSSLQAEVELCGVTVDVSREVMLHQVQENTTKNQTRVTGEELERIFFLHRAQNVGWGRETHTKTIKTFFTHGGSSSKLQC